MLHDFRELKYWWEVSEVGRWGRWKVMRLQGGKGGRVVRWEGGRLLVLLKSGEYRGSPRFYLFVSDVNQRNKGDGLKIFLCACRDGKILLRSSVSC